MITLQGLQVKKGGVVIRLTPQAKLVKIHRYYTTVIDENRCFDIMNLNSQKRALILKHHDLPEPQETIVQPVEPVEEELDDWEEV